MFEIVLIIFALVFFVGIVVILLSLRRDDSTWKKETTKKLNEYKKGIKDNNEVVVKDSLIKTDILLDHTLKHYKYSGNTMGERLKSARNDFEWKDYDAMWKAHKARNALVHEVDFSLSKKEMANHYYSLRKGILHLM